MTVDPETPGDDLIDEQPPRPWWAPITLVAFVSLVVCSYIGTAVSTKWVNTNPEGLLLLSSRVRHLVAVAGGDIAFWAYFWIGFVRLALAFVVCHLIGRAYGRTVLIWFGKYLGVRAEQIHKIMGMFHQAEWFVIPFFAGSNIVAAISGISRVSCAPAGVAAVDRARRAARVLVDRRPHRRRADRHRARLPEQVPDAGADRVRRPDGRVRGRQLPTRSELRTLTVQELRAWQL